MSVLSTELPKELYIGLMSGTSLDGVDAVLVDFASARPVGPVVLAHSSAALPSALKADLLALNTPADNELHRAALSANALARLYADLVADLLQSHGITSASAITAIGVHGQTVRHRPQEFDGTGYTLQLNNPALLAELCGMDVVADFRSRDVAAGGQGAPLVPPFHQAFFGITDRHLAVLNIGGMTNLTLLGPENALCGFDCGPGNALLDAWCQEHTQQAFDAAGRWAAQGQVHAALLARLLDTPFFAKPPPKSTGRDLFNRQWLADALAVMAPLPAQDVQATLAELTAQTCATSLKTALPECRTLIVCGGGALNDDLMARLQAALPSCRVASSAEFGLPVLQVEATAFAWLARQTLMRQSASVPSVTGSRAARILGAIYPAAPLATENPKE